MKIIELRAENIKNLKVVEIRPEDGAVILEGKNGAGKSAILDAIFMAITGKKIEQPIRNGEARAEIKVDLGKYKVRKIFTAKGERLEVTSEDGAAYPSPQSLLNGIIGQLSFDPLEFADLGRTKAGERQQHKILSDLVGLNFEKLDAKRQEFYDERTIKFREIKGMDPSKYAADPSKPLPIDALIGAMEKPAPGTPRKEINIADAAENVAQLEAKAKKYQIVLEANEHAEKEAEKAQQDLEADKDSIKREIARLQANLKDLEAKKPPVAKTDPLPEKITEKQLEKARQALVEVDEKNRAIRAAIEYDKKVGQLEDAKTEIERLEREMAKIDREKKQRIKDAAFPITGLSLDNERVFYNEKPMSQLSTGEQIRVSTAVAMALNPNFKVILVREGSLLDSTGMKEITKLAKDRDYQIWIERVADKKGVGIYIEDGSVSE